MINILLVDDHDLVRAGLKSILETSEEFRVVAEADSGEQALEWLQNADPLPDVVLMDINMPGIGGIEATRRIRHLSPDIKIIAVTALKENPFPAQLIEAGAQGYVTKGCPAEEMFDAVKTVVAGKNFVASQISNQVTLENIGANGDKGPFDQLSSREMQVMLMITQGASNQYISDSLFLSPKTISTYRHRLFEKLNVSNDVELTHMAIRYGVVDQ
ncbi:MAG: response regulator [Chromatiales bacterium]|jgi:two-component system invasion response regulator UvrY